MWLFALEIILLVNIIAYIWYVIDNRKYKDIEAKIPGPPLKFFFGNALEFGNDVVDIFNNSRRLIKTYGPVVRIWQGPFRLQLFITNPDYVEYFLSSTVHIKKSDGYNLFHPLMGLGLITSTGDRWRKHRKILNPAFHFKILEQFFDHFNSAGITLINKLKQDVGNKVDIVTYINLYSLEVLCESSLKIETHVQEHKTHPLIVAAEGFLEIFFERFFSLTKRYDFLFQFSGDCGRQNKHLNVIHSFTDRVIQQRKKDRLLYSDEASDECGIKTKKAFLDVLLDSKQLSDADIRQEVDTIFIAGHETVTTAISFGLFELAKHSTIQKKLLDEIHDVVGPNKNTPISLKNIQDMKYLDCVMKEIFRLYPSVPFFERKLVEDVVLDGIRIPKDTEISFHPYVYHRNENIFPNPDSFDPDRFLCSDIERRHPYAIITFSAGPRNCIGSKYATFTCKTVIVNVIRNFELHPVQPAHEPLLANATVLKSMNGLPVILKCRE